MAIRVRRRHDVHLKDPDEGALPWEDLFVPVDPEPPAPPPPPPPPTADFTGSPVIGYAPLEVSFIDASAGSITARSWTFGDAGLSSSVNPTHIYTNPGTYSVSLTVTGPGGADNKTRMNYIQVNALPPPPVADFSGTPVSGIVPLTVDFTDLSTGVIDSWAWDFQNDGTTDSLQQNPSFQFTSVGSYSVKLTVSGPGGSDFVIKSAYVAVLPTPPVADFSALPLSGTAPLLVNFSDLSSGSPSAWAWDFQNDLTVDSTTQNPSFTYNSPGVYTVKLVATNAGGSDSEVKASYITVLPPAPVADFSADVVSGPAPLLVNFTDLSTNNPTSWAWDFQDNGSVDSTLQNPSFSFTSPGSYSVKLTASNAGGSGSVTKTTYVTVTPPAPVVNFSGAPLTGVAPLLVNFTDLSTGSITGWYWEFGVVGDGASSTLQNPSYTYNSPGSYTVSLTATGPGGSTFLDKVNYVVVSGGSPTPAIYYAQTLDPYWPEFSVYAPKGPALDKRNEFLAAIINPGAIEFEEIPRDLTPTTVPRVLAFSGPQSGITATFTYPLGAKVTNVNNDGSGFNGRFNTTPYTDFDLPPPEQWLEFKDEITVTFSSPVQAFGFYGTDFGDFNGRVKVVITFQGGTQQTYDVNTIDNSPNGNLIFWGFTSGAFPVTAIRLFCYYNVPPSPGFEDFFGFDSLVVGNLP